MPRRLVKSPGRPLRRFEAIIIAAMLALEVSLLLFFVFVTGFRIYLLFVLVNFAGWPFFVYQAFRRGQMLAGRRTVSRDHNAAAFYVDMAVVLVFYLVMVGFMTGLFMQEAGYLPRS